MRLLGRGWQQSLIGAYEKPPAMPEDIYFYDIVMYTDDFGILVKIPHLAPSGNIPTPWYGIGILNLHL